MILLVKNFLFRFIKQKIIFYIIRIYQICNFIKLHIINELNIKLKT